MEAKTIQEVKDLIVNLSPDNKKYVLAVANALTFSQHQRKRNRLRKQQEERL